MAQEIIFGLGVNTGDAVQSVDKVTDSLKQTDKATQDVQEEFANLRGEIKNQTKAVEDLSKKWGENSKEADEARKVLGELNNAYDSLGKTTVDLGAKFEDVYGEMQPLSTQISEMEDRMYELARSNQTTGTEFQTLQSKVAEYKKIIIETDRAVDLLAEQGKGLGTALAIGTTVTAGYGALQGGMALLGGESEELQETFVKLQAVQTVLTSLEQLKLSLDKQSVIVTKAKAISTKILTAGQYSQATATGVATTASKALRVAMLSIPIVAIIAGIVALVSAIAYFAKGTADAEEVNEKLTKSFEKQDAVLAERSAKIIRDTDNRIAIAKSEGASKEELHQMELERLRKEEAIRNISTKTQLAQIDKKRLAYQRALAQGNTDLAKEIKDEIKQIRDKYKSLKALDGQYEVDKQVMENNFNKESQDATDAKNKENADKAKAWREKRKAEEEAEAKLKLERERLYQDLMTQNIEDQMLRESTMLNLKFAREREALIEKYGQDTELLKQLDEKQATERAEFNQQLQEGINAKKAEADTKALEAEKLLAEQQRKDEVARLEGKLIAMREDFEATQELKAELALMEMETALEQENLTEGEKFKIKEEYNAKLMALETESAERRKQLNKDVADASFQVAEQGLAGAQSISDAVFSIKKNNAEKGSQAELANAKKQFEINKKIQIASAVISGIQGVINALTAQSVIPEPFGSILKGVNAGIVAGVTVANVAKIKSTKFDGGGGGGASAPSVRPPNIPSQADISGGTDNESTLTDGLTDNNAPTNKVVLVDSDIKAGLANEAKVDVISTIG